MKSQYMKNQIKKTRFTIENPPNVSVIMPIRNEARYIDRSLGSVLAQDYPAEYMEVLIVDGYSTDGTRELVKNKQKKFSNLHLLDNPGLYVSPGLNDAIVQTKSEFLIFIDGHCEIASDYVSNCVLHLLNDDIDCVGGPIETIGENTIGQAIAIAMSSYFGVGWSAFRVMKDKTMLVDTVPFPAYSKLSVEKTGFFDNELVCNQDDEYNFRLRKLGGKILLASDVRSRYYCRNSLSALWSQYYRYGYWKVRLLQKYPRQMSLRQFVPPIFVASVISSAFLVFFTSQGWALLIVIMGSYIIANLIASFSIFSYQGWKRFFLLPIVYTILHVSYGLGFLIGFVKFFKHWFERGATFRDG